ncbi:uncharacterized protein VTP21DRAFT_6536 [Calcarisporiella thermophila]|uniref:uncharacterized protein n=1 Tax=Calcarisporiella thermophila TaxID=911321 RepID=UPI0037437A39
MKFVTLLVTFFALVSLVCAMGWQETTLDAATVGHSFQKRSFFEKRGEKKVKKGGKKKGKKGGNKKGGQGGGPQRGTWYSGNDLKNSYCYGIDGKGSYNAKDTDMIAAMKNIGGMCFKCLAVKGGNNTNGKTIVVKVIDKCGGCKNGNDVDLTKSAFSQLASLGKGVIGISWRVVRCPANGRFPK